MNSKTCPHDGRVGDACVVDVAVSGGAAADAAALALALRRRYTYPPTSATPPAAQIHQGWPRNCLPPALAGWPSGIGMRAICAQFTHWAPRTGGGTQGDASPR